jgi:chromosome segregation ATPase
MADQPPNQTLVSVNQNDWNRLQQENHVLKTQVQASADEIKDQAVRISTMRAQIMDKDNTINQIKGQAQQLGLKGQAAAEDLARVEMDNNAFEEQNKKLTKDLEKANKDIAAQKKKITTLENKVKKLAVE